MANKVVPDDFTKINEMPSDHMFLVGKDGDANLKKIFLEDLPFVAGDFLPLSGTTSSAPLRGSIELDSTSNELLSVFRNGAGAFKFNASAKRVEVEGSAGGVLIRANGYEAANFGDKSTVISGGNNRLTVDLNGIGFDTPYIDLGFNSISLGFDYADFDFLNQNVSLYSKYFNIDSVGGNSPSHWNLDVNYDGYFTQNSGVFEFSGNRFICNSESRFYNNSQFENSLYITGGYFECYAEANFYSGTYYYGEVEFYSDVIFEGDIRFYRDVFFEGNYVNLGNNVIGIGRDNFTLSFECVDEKIIMTDSMRDAWLAALGY